MPNNSADLALATKKLESSGLADFSLKDLGMKVYSAEETLAAGFFHALPSLVIHYWDPFTPGKFLTHRPHWPPFARVRFLVDPPADRKGKVAKYTQAQNIGVCAYFAPFVPWAELLVDPAKTLYITEGELKATKGCAMGFPVIGLGGVDNISSKKTGYTFLPELERINWVQREVVIVFDKDPQVRPGVMEAARRLSEALEERGALCYTLNLPGPADVKVGLDDYFLTSTAEDFVKLQATRESVTLAAALWSMNERFVKLRSPRAVVDLQDMRLLKDDDFAGYYGNQTVPEQRIERNGEISLKEVPVSTRWLAWKQRMSCLSPTYAPGEPKFTADGNFNLWNGWGCEPKKGDVTLFKNLLNRMFPGRDEKEELRWFLQWLAYPIQNPGAKLFSSILLWGNETGTGKTLIGTVMRGVYGDENFAEVTKESLESGFNSWAMNRQFVLGAEITGTDSHTFGDKLKHLITGDTVRLNEKNLAAFDMPNRMNFLLTSNHANAVLVDSKDRRYWVKELKHKLDEAWAQDVFDPFFHSPEGIAAIHHYLKNDVDCSDFKPRQAPPMTADKLELIELSRSAHEAWAHDLMEDPEQHLKVNGYRGTKRDLFKAGELLDMFNATVGGRSLVKEATLMGALKRCGCLRMAQAPWAPPGGAIQRPRLWAVRNLDKWAKSNNATAIKKHLTEQFGQPGGLV